MAKSEPIDRLRNITHCVNCFHCKHIPSSGAITCDMAEWAFMEQVSFEELVSDLKFAEIAYHCKHYQSMEDE